MRDIVRTAVSVLVAAALALPALASAGERILILETVEDPRFPPDPSVCAAAPFSPVNVRLGASVWSVHTRSRDGAIAGRGAEESRFLGTVTACALLVTPAPFVPQHFLVRFDLEDGSYVASGTCSFTSGDVPVPGLLLLGCALRLTGFPAGVLGGSVTSNSVFNPAHLPGYGTGSIWTVRLYDARERDD